MEGGPIDFQPAFRPSFETFAGFAPASAFPPAIGNSISLWPSTLALAQLAFGFFGLEALAGFVSSSQPQPRPPGSGGTLRTGRIRREAVRALCGRRRQTILLFLQHFEHRLLVAVDELLRIEPSLFGF
jgi:hypothetical protein